MPTDLTVILEHRPGELARLGEIAGEVFVIDVEDRPAALGELTRRLAEANVNVDLAYTTFTGGKIVLATDDVGSARSVLRA